MVAFPGWSLARELRIFGWLSNQVLDTVFVLIDYDADDLEARVHPRAPISDMF